MMGKLRAVLCLLTLVFSVVQGGEEKSVYEQRRRMQRPPDRGEWKQKDILDYNDMDVEKLADQWEVSFIFSSWPNPIGQSCKSDVLIGRCTFCTTSR